MCSSRRFIFALVKLRLFIASGPAAFNGHEPVGEQARAGTDAMLRFPKNERHPAAQGNSQRTEEEGEAKQNSPVIIMRPSRRCAWLSGHTEERGPKASASIAASPQNSSPDQQKRGAQRAPPSPASDLLFTAGLLPCHREFRRLLFHCSLR